MKFIKHRSLSTAVVAILSLSLTSSFVATHPQKVVIEVRIMGEWVSTELTQTDPTSLLGVIKLNDEPVVKFSTSSSGAEKAAQTSSQAGGKSSSSNLLRLAMWSIIGGLWIVTSSVL